VKSPRCAICTEPPSQLRAVTTGAPFGAPPYASGGGFGSLFGERQFLVGN
jgi:hypothetical protein